MAARRDSDHAFACSLHRALAGAPGNLAHSPGSLRTALSMLWAGAQGETAAEIARTLGLADDRAAGLEAAHRARTHEIREPRCTLRAANRLFGERSYGFEAPFLEESRKVFGAALEPLDFRGDPEAARARVNGWVAEETAQRIRDLLPPRSVGETTPLVLVNAVHFLGDWESPFTELATRPKPFHAPGGMRDVPTMHQTQSFAYAAVDGVSVLELPYVGRTLSMVFVLPEAVDGMTALEQRLSPDRLATWLAALRTQRVAVALPKFTIEPSGTLQLAATLRALGIRLAFDAERADFTRMADPPDPRLRLYVDEVFHKAFVRVDERGTEAAAASAVAMAPGAAPPREKPAEFRADHPFLFLLRDLKTGSLWFVGRVVAP